MFAAGPKDPEPAYDAVMTRGAVPAQARVHCEQNDGVADESAGTTHDDTTPDRSEAPVPPRG